ncbi:MAG TPA: hypothetical protein VN688_04165 [Gemmataceae bacterium]|nr:hypothetical protein [Gemmataceae bacterium]
MIHLDIVWRFQANGRRQPAGKGYTSRLTPAVRQNREAPRRDA